jgi:hypothetical protein
VTGTASLVQGASETLAAAEGPGVWGRSPRRASETASTRAPAERGVEGRSPQARSASQICHISTPVMPLLPSTLPNLPTHPAGLELLLNVSQLNLPNPHTRHVLLTKQPMYARRLCAPAQRPANSANSANSARRPGRCSSLSLLLFFVEGANMAGAPVPQGIAC